MWWTCTVLTIGLALILLVMLMTHTSVFRNELFSQASPDASIVNTSADVVSTPVSVVNTSGGVVSTNSTIPQTALQSTNESASLMPNVETITTTPVLTAATLTDGPLQPQNTTVPTVISIAHPFLATQNPWLKQDVTPVVVSGMTPAGTTVSVNVVPSQQLSL